MKLFGVGPQIFDLCQPVVAEGFFTTISYRLEPNGPGSRFPVIINQLSAGRMEPANAGQALRELAEIETGLASLPLDQVVWSRKVLSGWDDRQLPVNHAAKNLREYFIAADGRPLVDALRGVVAFCQHSNKLVGLANRQAQQVYRRAWAYLIGGILWTVVGFVFFRHWVLTSLFDSMSQSTKAVSGPLAWPIGIFLFGTGVVMLAMAQYPALRQRLRTGSNLQVLLTVAAAGLYLVVSWSTYHQGTTRKSTTQQTTTTSSGDAQLVDVPKEVPTPPATTAPPVAVSPQPPPPAERVRVDGNAQQANLISRTKPTYPPLARQARIQGVVKLEAVINKDGSVENLTVVSGHPLLIQAALDAVRHWRYKPTIRNGVPVEVVTTVDVNFKLAD
jgi:TonB family protein